MTLLLGLNYLLAGVLAPGVSRLLGQKAGTVVLTILSLITSVAVIVIAYVTAFDPHMVIGNVNWFSLEATDVLWALTLDSLTLTILLAVTLVGTFVTSYSTWYIARDPSMLRFLALVLVFVHFMVWLVLAKSLALLFLGWEGVGVASFLLVSFWSTRNLAVQASIQAFLINRVGDMLLILALTIFIISTGSWDLLTLTELTLLGETTSLELGLWLLIGGAIGKSAQIGLHAWLPNAIEAPTPVSALIHAATLVTAGVYIIARLGPLLLKTGNPVYVCFIGGTSVIFAGLIGLSQTDFKRVIAFSTISQVGYIVLGCGVGAIQASIFILFTHAFYKALLFLGAGAVIHATADIQDIRLLGSEGAYLPATKTMLIAASLSLGASPFTSGDFSKDVLIELVAGTQISSKSAMWILTVGATGLTAAYTGRLCRLVLTAEPQGVAPSPEHDIPPSLIMILSILICLSVSGGWIGGSIYELGLLSSLADYPHTSVIWVLEHQTSPFSLILPVICGAVGLLAGTGSPSLLDPGTVSGSSMANVSRALGGWESATQTLLIFPILRTTAWIQKYQNSGALELTGPTGLANTIYSSAFNRSNGDLRLTIWTYVLVLILPSVLNLHRLQLGTTV